MKEVERYPDPNQFDEVLYGNLLLLPDGGSLDLPWIRQHVWQQASSFCVPKDRLIRGMQANMFCLEVEGRQGETDRTQTKSFLVKRIVPKELPPKASEEIWREFVKSIRTEIEFYANLLKPDNANIRNLFPKVYYSAGTPRDLDIKPQETAFIIVMEDLSPNYYQTPMMNRHQAECVLKSMARLHAHFWGLGQESARERGGFWVLQKRLKYKEVERAEETWKGFIERFPELKELVQNVSSLGHIIKDRAVELDGVVEAGAITVIHGDAKGWNFFFGKEGAEEKILFIDLQWAGRGHPLQDVAYALTTTLCGEELENMEDLVDFYVDQLKTELAKKKIELPAALRGSFDDIWLDYARVVVTGLWKNLNKESIEKNKSKVGPSMINRSWDHVLFITRRMAKLLMK